MITITPGQVYRSRATGMTVTVTSVSPGGNTVHYAWAEPHNGAEVITGWLFHGQFLTSFELVTA